MHEPEPSWSEASFPQGNPSSGDGAGAVISDWADARAESSSSSLSHDTTYWQFFGEQKILILACTVLAALSAGVGSLLQSPSYTSSVDIVVGKGASFFSPAEAGAVQPFTATMRDLLHSETVAANVAARLRDGTTPQELLRHYSISTNPTTALLHVTVTSGSSTRAIRIAALLGEIFPALVERRFRSESGATSRESKSTTVSAVVWNAGSFRSEERPSPLLTNILLGMLVGFILGVAIAIFRRRRKRSTVDVEALPDLGQPKLGQGQRSLAPRWSPRSE